MPLVDYDSPGVAEPNTSNNSSSLKERHYLYPACPNRARRVPKPDLVVLYKQQQAAPPSPALAGVFDAGAVYKARLQGSDPRAPSSATTGSKQIDASLPATKPSLGPKPQLTDLRRHAAETAQFAPQAKKRRKNAGAQRPRS